MSRTNSRRLALLASVLPLLGVLVACGGGGGGSAPAPILRATGGPGVDLDGLSQPEVLLLFFSGHTSGAIPLSSDANQTYLDAAGSVGPKLASFFADRGTTTVVRHFADRLHAPDVDADGRPDRLDQLGFLEALSILRQAAEDWVDGQTSPTDVVVVSHSHGATWAHLLCEAADGRVAPGPFAIRILATLDGVQTGWDGEHAGPISAWWDALPGKVFEGFALPRDPSAAADAVVTDVGLRNVKDVVWPNVRFAYEVLSDDSLGPILRDLVRNVPLLSADLVPTTDPSGTTLWSRDTRAHEILINGVVVAPPVGDVVPSESHGSVHAAGGPSLQWLCDRLAERFP